MFGGANKATFERMKAALIGMFQAYVNFETSGKPIPLQRRIRTINLSCLIGALFGFVLTPVYVFYDFYGLWPYVITGTVGPIFTFVSPLLHRWNHTWVPLAAYIIWLPIVAFASYCSGADGGFHFILLFFAVAGPLIFGVDKLNYVIPTAVMSSILFLTTVLFFREPSGLLKIDDTLNIFTTLSVAPCAIILLFLIVFSSSNAALLSERALQDQFEGSERLLLKLLPDSIASTLKSNPSVRIAEGHENVTILFADIVGFTHRTAHEPVGTVVASLDALFRDLDNLAETHGIEKIKTIGDAYMAAAGLTKDDANGAHASAAMAAGIHKVCQQHGIQMRVGLHCGLVIAGVVGRQKPHFDVWGKTVNIAAAMEANSQPGRTLVTREFAQLLGADALIFPHGKVSAKGAGMIEANWLDTTHKGRVVADPHVH